MFDFVTYMKNCLLIFVLVFAFLSATNLANHPETVGEWLRKVDQTRYYEGLPIDVN